MSLKVEASPTYQNPLCSQSLESCWESFCKAITDLFLRIVNWFVSLCCPPEERVREYTIGPVGCRVIDKTDGAAQVTYAGFRHRIEPAGAHHYHVTVNGRFLSPPEWSGGPAEMLRMMNESFCFDYRHSTHFTLERDPEQPHLLRIKEEDSLGATCEAFVDTRHPVDDTHFVALSYRPQPMTQAAADERMMTLFLDAPQRPYHFAAFSPEHGEVVAVEDQSEEVYLAVPHQDRMQHQPPTRGEFNPDPRLHGKRVLVMNGAFLLQYHPSLLGPPQRLLFNRLPATLLDQSSIVTQLRERLVIAINAGTEGRFVVDIVRLIAACLTPALATDLPALPMPAARTSH